jgi:hypothetical protein
MSPPTSNPNQFHNPALCNFTARRPVSFRRENIKAFVGKEKISLNKAAGPLDRL